MKGPDSHRERRNRGSIGVIQIIIGTSIQIILINIAHHGSKYFVFSFDPQYIRCSHGKRQNGPGNIFIRL